MTTRNIFIALLLLFASHIATGQQENQDRRTLETRIADLLAQLPAPDITSLQATMAVMAELGEEGLLRMAGMLTPPEKGNDALVRYAIGSFSKFVTVPGRESDRALAQQSWCRAMEATGEPEVRAFLIAQLQQTGNDQAVPCLARYLTHDQLSDPAARALAVINTREAGHALVNALPQVTGTAQISITEALGNMKYTGALADVTPLAASADTRLRKVAQYALAMIGAPESYTVLYNAALKSGFTYEPSNATASYLLWMDRMVSGDHRKLVEKYCKTLIKKCVAANQVPARTTALSLLVEASGSAAAPYLYKALESPYRPYRMAALDLSRKLRGENQTLAWVKKAGHLKGETRADVITMLGERGDKVAIPYVRQMLSDSDESVRIAAIHALAKLEGDQALPDLLMVMKKGNTAEIAAVKTQLLSLGGDTILNGLVQGLPAMNAPARIAAMEVLSSRKYHPALQQVYPETRSELPGVRPAAFQALSGLVSEQDLGELLNLLKQVQSPDEIAAVQSAILAAVMNIQPDRRATAIIEVLNTSGTEDKAPFYGVLAGIGTDQALEKVVNDFHQLSAPAMKKATFGALSEWTGPNAIDEIYAIAVKPEHAAYRDDAVRACVRLIRQSGYPADQRLLLLRKTMDLAGTTASKNMILEETGNCPTYLALKFAAVYLDDAELQQTAARAVSSIALSDESLAGEDIRDLLNRILNILSGTESEYMKEAIRKHLDAMPTGKGFVPLFNGKDLTGWKGLVENPVVRAAMKPAVLANAQAKADTIMQNGWKVENGILVFTGHGENLCTAKSYGDFEMIVDWKILDDGDAGIYLRGSPQVQIWDTSRRDVGAQVGSGGLYNNAVHERNPLRVADNAVGEWNTFRILMLGERVTVYLNGVLVVDNIIMENYWDRTIPIFPEEQIELQAHGTWVGYRDIYIREIPRPEPYRIPEQEKAEGFAELFDGLSLFNWTGNTRDYVVENGCIAVYPEFGGRGNLYTKAEYGDFILRFEFQLTPGANNGIGIRTPMEGDAAYVGMEIQVLDNTSPIYRNLEEYQYHGSVYGVIPAKREYLRPVGEWNEEEIYIRGTSIRVTLNGTFIVKGDIAEASRNGTLDHKEHPGLKNTKGHIGFLGHGSVVKFRNLRIKELTE
jgi:HEAT repeat protein